MHGPLSVNFISAQQAKETYQYKNTKEERYKTNVAIWCNKMCRQEFFTKINMRNSASRWLLL